MHGCADPDRAGRLYQLAAAKGHATAAFNLACLHREGRLTPPAQPPPPRRHAEAATLAGALPLADQAGSEQGTEPFLGSYDGGAEAGRWLRRAAELGLGRWGVRRRLFARWRRRWAVWIAVAVRVGCPTLDAMPIRPAIPSSDPPPPSFALAFF